MEIILKETGFKPGIYITAYDAIDRHQSEADYECDGTNDHIQIQAAINKLEGKGGVIQLSEGHFNISSSIIGADNITIIGSGMGATIITQTAENVTSFDFITNCNYDGSHSGIKDLTLILPQTNSGDGMQFGTRSQIENIRLGGGTPYCYGIRITNAYLYSVKNIYTTEFVDPTEMQPNLNLILIECTDNLYNYGNAIISNIGGLINEDCKGIIIKGVENSHPINCIDVSQITLAGRPIKTNQVAISLENVGSCNFSMLDLEQFATAIDMKPSRGCVFSTCYFDATTHVGYDVNSSGNLFIGGHNPLIPLNIGNYYLGGGWAGVIPSPPTTGTWEVGNRVYNIDPEPGEYIGYVCVESGTPGIWKGFGLIDDS